MSARITQVIQRVPLWSKRLLGGVSKRGTRSFFSPTGTDRKRTATAVLFLFLLIRFTDENSTGGADLIAELFKPEAFAQLQQFLVKIS